MSKLLGATALSLFVLGSASNSAAQVSFDIRIGTPPPPPRYYVVRPQPAPEFVWVEGYWYPQGNHYRWHNGYWTRPPYEGAYWVEPYYVRGYYFAGHWEGP